MASDDKFAALERLAKLRTEGIITEEEFAAEKAKLLAGAYDQPAATAAPTGSDDKAAARRRALWMVPLVILGLAVLIAINATKTSTTANSAASTDTSAPSSDTRVPACDSQDARDMLKNALEDSPMARLTNIRLLDVANPVERSYDAAKPERVCAADLTLNAGSKHEGYRIYLKSNGTDPLLETIPDPGPGADATPTAASDVSTPAAADTQNSETAATDGASQIEPARGSNNPGVLSVISEAWLVGRWMNTAANFKRCSDDLDQKAETTFSPDHGFTEYEASGTWRLDGTTLRESGDAEGDAFNDDEVIIAADGTSFTLRGGDGKTITYVRCDR